MSKHKTTNSTGASNLVKRPAAPAVVAFCDAIDDENRNIPGGRISREFVDAIMELVNATQNYYEYGVRTAAACRKTLVGGLAGGAIIGVGIYGFISYIRKRRYECRINGD